MSARAEKLLNDLEASRKRVVALIEAGLAADDASARPSADASVVEGNHARCSCSLKGHVHRPWCAYYPGGRMPTAPDGSSWDMLDDPDAIAAKHCRANKWWDQKNPPTLTFMNGCKYEREVSPGLFWYHGFGMGYIFLPDGEKRWASWTDARNECFKRGIELNFVDAMWCRP
jgi:hypothetical protein